jgi:hypothetical protein
MPGDTITVTFSCGPGNQRDWVAPLINPNLNSGIGATPFGNEGSYVNGATSGALRFTIPNVISDRPASYVFGMFLNDGWQLLATSNPVAGAPTISPPPPTAALPAALAADPFTPAHVMTVCASGCSFPSLGDAVLNAHTKGWDYVQIKISAGDYPYPQNLLVGGNLYPAHLWIKGVSADGHTFPHLYGVTDTAGSIIGTGAGWPASANPSLTLDNLEIGPWNYWAMKQIDATALTLRNVYVRDSQEGLITGNTTDFTLNIYNSVFARNGGGPGPAHDIYIGEGNFGNTVNVVNSVFEQSLGGHAFKERAKTLNAKCSMFIVNQDGVYMGSETIDLSEGGDANLQHILSASGGAAPAFSVNQAWDSMRYGYEAGVPPKTSYANNRPVITGSVFLDDDPTTNHDFFTMGLPATNAPVVWQRNKFVWATAAADGGAVWYSTARYGHPGDIVLDSTNQSFHSRAAAGFREVGPYPKGWRDFLPMMPAACKDPVGLVKIPAS